MPGCPAAGGAEDHQDEEHFWASGIYKPKGNDHHLVHDDAAPLPVVGKYDTTFGGVDTLVTMQQNGLLIDGEMYTSSVTISQPQLLDGSVTIAGFAADIQALNALGYIQWVGLAEAVDIWRTIYAEEPSTLRWHRFGDSNNDDEVSGPDVPDFLSCMTGSDPPGGITDTDCYTFDHEPDDDLDWNHFTDAWTGAGDPPSSPLQCAAEIPTVSEWGILAMTLLTLTAGIVVLTRRRTGSPC